VLVIILGQNRLYVQSVEPCPGERIQLFDTSKSLNCALPSSAAVSSSADVLSRKAARGPLAMEP
jgi:hypothetical protein